MRTRPFHVAARFGATFIMVAALILALVVRFGPPWPVIILISLALPVLALTALMASLVAAWLGRARGRWMALDCGALAAWLLVDSLSPMLWHRLPAPSSQNGTARIVEFNAWILNDAPLAASRWIESQHPDAVVLLEAAGAARPIVDRLLPAFPYQVSCRGARPCSTVILARRPFLAARGLAHGDADNRRALSAAYAVIDSAQGPVPLLALHLSRPMSASDQSHEINLLIGDMHSLSSSGLVVAGDFNLPPWSRALRQVSDGLSVRTPGGERPTWQVPGTGSALPTLWPIDHVLLGPDWTAARLMRGPALGSDHYPLLVELSRDMTHAHH